MLAVASLHVVTLEATETTGGSSLGDVLPKKLISSSSSGDAGGLSLKPVRTPEAILGSLGVCIYVPASRHWLISYSPIHLT